jgi:adenosylmethionine-8-amino-7-oxononanoate aminotransferase
MADGVDGDALLLAPPFVVEERELDEIVRILEETFSELNKIQVQENRT